MHVAALLLCQAVSFLDQPALFSPPLAHPRSVELGMDVAANTAVPFTSFVAVFGARLPVATLALHEHRLQLGFDGGVWTQLVRQPTNILFPVVMADYMAAIPIMYRFRGFSAEAVISHISAHRSDGSPLYGQPVLRYSVEFVHTRASYEMRVGSFWLRQFVSFGSLVRATGAPASRYFVGGGVEVLGPAIAEVCRPLAAIDVDWYGDHASLNSAAEIGVLFTPTRIAQLRITLSAYSGKSRDGQQLDYALDRLAFALKIRFADWARKLD